MLNKCIVEFDVKGVKRGFKFGTSTVGMVMEMRGIKTLIDFITAMSDPGNIPFVLDLLYCSAVSYARASKKEVDFTKDDVADWIDEIGVDESFAMINRAFTQYTPKESKKKSRLQKIFDMIGASKIGRLSRFQFSS
jgi:hypothetical protein